MRAFCSKSLTIGIINKQVMVSYYNYRMKYDTDRK